MLDHILVFLNPTRTYTLPDLFAPWIPIIALVLCIIAETAIIYIAFKNEKIVGHIILVVVLANVLTFLLDMFLGLWYFRMI